MERYILITERVRANAIEAVRRAPDGYTVTVSEPKRSSDQNSMFHAIIGDIVKSGLKWAGKERNLEEWKALIISGHAIATNKPGEIIPGLESEFVAIRESSARMSVARATSLIEYTLAFCASNGVELKEAERQGYQTNNSY